MMMMMMIHLFLLLCPFKVRLREKGTETTTRLSYLNLWYMNSIRRRRREENDGEYYCNNAIMNTSERRRDVSLRSFSLSFSLSLVVVTEQSAQSVMIFSPPKSSKTTEIFSTTKKNSILSCFFSSVCSPHNRNIYSQQY